MKSRRLAALLGAFALMFGASAAVVLATQPTGHKVTICHATSSETNPYVNPTVDIASAGYNGSTSGHAGQGRDGVWYPGAKGDGFDWGDIIPPYTYGDFQFEGLNWTDAGKEIYENGCTTPREPEHDPKIQIVKTPSVTSLPAGGGEVIYSYVVTATGSNVPLSDISVEDDKCAALIYTGGDANGDEFLDPSESWTYSCTTTLTATTTNVVVATGHDGDDKVTDDDTATVTVPTGSSEPSSEPSSPPQSSEPSSEPSSPPQSSEPSGSVEPDDSTPPSASSSPSGGVGAETDTPTAPPSDVDGIVGDATATLPLMLFILGAIGLGAFVLTPKRAKR